mmetsp:Transcript_31066/g.77487  ORF Transcript_31066/g.77487 Transcript_31066/m.77487 type:complete len:423 (+) Transcript_31066:380-1648(+)
MASRRRRRRRSTTSACSTGCCRPTYGCSRGGRWRRTSPRASLPRTARTSTSSSAGGRTSRRCARRRSCCLASMTSVTSARSTRRFSTTAGASPPSCAPLPAAAHSDARAFPLPLLVPSLRRRCSQSRASARASRSRPRRCGSSPSWGKPSCGTRCGAWWRSSSSSETARSAPRSSPTFSTSRSSPVGPTTRWRPRRRCCSTTSPTPASSGPTRPPPSRPLPPLGSRRSTTCRSAAPCTTRCATPCGAAASPTLSPTRRRTHPPRRGGSFPSLHCMPRRGRRRRRWRSSPTAPPPCPRARRASCRGALCAHSCSGRCHLPKGSRAAAAWQRRENGRRSTSPSPCDRPRRRRRRSQRSTSKSRPVASREDESVNRIGLAECAHNRGSSQLSEPFISAVATIVLSTRPPAVFYNNAGILAEIEIL